MPTALRRALIALLPAAIAGCGHYLPPLSGPTAKLRFVTSPGHRTEVHAMADTRCLGLPGATIAILGEGVAGGTGQGRSQGIPLATALSPRNISEIVIPAGEPFAARLAATKAPGPTGENWSYPACVRGFVLAAREGEHYEVLLEQFRAGCQLNVFRITREKDGNYVRRVATEGRELSGACR